MKKIVLTGLFVFGLMFAGTSVNAMGGEVHLVGKDGVVINQLRYTQTLRRGTVNANVLALQKKLKEFGFYHKALDSDYGSGTIEAVKKFQRAKNLKDDGIAGPKTYAMILATDSLPTGSNIDFSQFTNAPTKACTKEYAPVCGLKKSSRSINTKGWKQTYSNKCMAGLDNAKILYKGKCQTTRPIDILPIEDRPFVETDGVSNITEESAVFHGDVDTDDTDIDEAFFVYGQSLSLITSVPLLYSEYHDINESGDNLQLTDSNEVGANDDGSFSEEADNLDENEGYYYRACIQFNNSENDDVMRCGEIKKFETQDGNGGPIISDCLEITPNSSNWIQNVGTVNRQIAEFTIKNNCSVDINPRYLGFNVISTFGAPQFDNIKVEIESDDDEHEFNVGELNVQYNNAFNGNHLKFGTSATPNQYPEIAAHDEIEVTVFADINGMHPSWIGGNGFSAFAVGLRSFHYKHLNQSYVYAGPEIYDNVVVVDYNNS